MNTKGAPSGLTKAFIDYIYSPEGSAIIEKSGYIPTGRKVIRHHTMRGGHAAAGILNMAFPFLRRSGTPAPSVRPARHPCHRRPVRPGGLLCPAGALERPGRPDLLLVVASPTDFGILPMLAGSLILSFSALLLAWPLSLGLACALQRSRPGMLAKNGSRASSVS